MIAGRLRHHIVIEHTERTRGDSFGAELAEHKTTIAARADVKWGVGGRADVNGEIVYPYDVTFMVWLYMETKISDYDTVVFRNQRYTIMSREPDTENRILYLKCKNDGRDM